MGVLPGGEFGQIGPGVPPGGLLSYIGQDLPPGGEFGHIDPRVPPGQSLLIPLTHGNDFASTHRENAI